jgi:hypothetical protein
LHGCDAQATHGAAFNRRQQLVKLAAGARAGNGNANRIFLAGMTI